MRFWLTLLIILAGLGVVAAFFSSTASRTAPPIPATRTAAPTAATSPAAGAGNAVAPAATPMASSPSTSTAAAAVAPSAATASYRVAAAPSAGPAIIGADPAGAPSSHKLRVELTSYGAAIKSVAFANYFTTAMSRTPYVVQHPVEAGGYMLYPFAARSITIGSQRLDLQQRKWSLEPASSVERAVYSLTVTDGDDQPVLRITRAYSLQPGAYELRCEQSIENLSGRALPPVVWEQNGWGDVPIDDAYMGDGRIIATGYLNLEYNPVGNHIYTEKAFLARGTLLDALGPSRLFWPSPELPAKARPVWVAAVNRYFTAVVFRPVDVSASQWTDARAGDPLDNLFPRIGMEVIGAKGPDRVDGRGVVVTLGTAAMTVAPGESARFDLSLFTGPRQRELMSQPNYAALEFPSLIVYSLGCTWCTFQWLAQLLLSFLKLIHFATFDWSIAIMALVLAVRLILHPITKKSQVNMARMGKQMASIKPEIEKINKKYADDPQQRNAETMRLYREKGINPANMLGCLPMILQMPIWVALYAMLYFAIELRHQPAFFGVFQALTGGRWGFLADLSSPDHFIQFFPESRVLNLYLIQLDYSALNILPLLMGVVYFFQQHLTMPPPATEEQAQQQKITKWMLTFMPLLFYSMPSGLTIYILASTLIAIVESLIVKKHIADEEARGQLFPTMPQGGAATGKGGGGFRERILRALESQQRRMDERRRK